MLLRDAKCLGEVWRLLIDDRSRRSIDQRQKIIVCVQLPDVPYRSIVGVTTQFHGST